MVIKKVAPFIIAFILLLGSVCLSSHHKQNNFQSKAIPVNNKTEKGTYNNAQNNDGEEMRAIWIPFMTLDMKGTDYSEISFKQKFDNIVKISKDHNINTLIVHVRSHSDAMYPSSYYPWSHLLSGNQGTDPGYDPLKYMVEATHNAGMKFHAWINPFRIAANNAPESLSETNPYVRWQKEEKYSNISINIGEDKYYNPAYPEVRQLIIDGVKEIVSNYDVDAIHFDDYFYPSDSEEIDKPSYDEYRACIKNAVPIDLTQWRVANINSLISGVYSAIKTINSNIEFGISPQANVKNNSKISADIYTWGKISGYVDYLCPQIYTNFDNPILPFDKGVKQWREIVCNENIKLYIGLGAYKANSEADGGSWKKSEDILKRQVEYLREEKADGFMIYSWQYLTDPQTSNEISNLMDVIKK